MHPDSEHCYVATLANNLLPGIIRFIQTVRLAGRPVDFLRRICAIPEADKRAEQVIKEAKGMYKRMLKGDFPRRPPTDGYVSALVRKIISLGKAARLSAATQLTDLLHEALRAEEEGRAPGVGPSATLTPAQVQGYVQQFFPAARSDELDMMMNLAGTGPLDIEEEAPGIELTCDMVLEGIKRLHADSAPGPSGWTNNAIKFVASFCRTDAERTRLGEAYARCFNAVWSGRMPASVRFAWTDTRVVFIPKASGGVRPLGLRECLYRLNARIVVRLKAPQIGMDFARNQLAIGVPGGCEIGAQLAQLQATLVLESTEDEIECGDDFIISCDDAKNCYNTIALGPAMVEMRSVAPDMMRGLHYLYGAPSTLIGVDGTKIGNAFVGAVQGCPLGTLITAVGLRPLDRKVEEIIAEVEAEHPRLTPVRPGTEKCTTIRFSDDESMAGRSVVIRAVRERSASAIAAAGLTLAFDKCEVFVADSDRVQPGTYSERRVTSAGLRILGKYVGTEEYRRTMGEKKLADKKPDYRALQKLPPRLAFQLLTACYNPRAMFLARIDGLLLRDGLKAFDNCIDDCLARIIDCPPGGRELLRTLRCISPKCGGLGVPAHAGMQVERATLLSRVMAITYIQQYRPWMVVVTRREDVWPEVDFGAGLLFADEVFDEERALLGSGTTTDIRKATSKIIDRYELRVAEGVRAGFEHDADGDSKRALLLSRQGVGSTGAFWRLVVGNQAGDKYFPGPHFTAMIRHQVFAPLLDAGGVVISHCKCCQAGRQPPVEITHHYSHAMACKQAAHATWRHDDGVMALHNLLKRGFLHGGEPGYRVNREESIPRQDGSGQIYRPDIFLDIGDKQRYIDFAVVDPGCPTYLAAGSAERPLAAAQAREEDKIADFRHRMSHVQDVEAVFIPFVVETTGRLGARAEAFLYDIGLRDEEVRRFKRHLPLLLARHGGRSLTQLRRGRRGDAPL